MSGPAPDDTTVATGAATPPTADTGWQRVHPATPLLRSWQVLAVAVVFFGQDIGEGLLRGNGVEGVTGDLAENRFVGALIGLGVLALVLGWALISWRCIRYRVTADALELHQGVLSRQHRSAPLDRLQAVDIVEPLVARVFGLAKLTLEVAGAGNSKIELAFLTNAQARRLRNHLLASASGLTSDSEAPPQVGESPEHAVFTVPTGRLIGSAALSATVGIVMIGVVAIAVTIGITGEAGFAIALVPAMLGTATVVWNQLTHGFGFRVAAAADGLRLRHGLFEQRTQTVPPGRVQAVRLRQPFLWRSVGWWTVEVNVAGYGSSTEAGAATNNVLLPVGSIDDALRVLAFVVPSLPHDAQLATGGGALSGFTPAPRQARWADPIGWRRHGFLVTEHALLIRGGRLRRQLTVVPHARTQSCAVWQGPLQRRLGLASFELHSTPGPIQPRVEHLAAIAAADLLERQTERARAARATSTDTWLAPVTTPTD